LFGLLNRKFGLCSKPSFQEPLEGILFKDTRKHLGVLFSDPSCDVSMLQKSQQELAGFGMDLCQLPSLGHC